MAKLSAPFCGKSLITMLLILFLGACSRGGPPPGSGKPPGSPVKLQSVETSTLEESSEFVGNLQAAKVVVLKTEADGKLVQILAGEGKLVAAGTPIVQIRPDKRQAQVGQAIANVNASIAARENALAQLKQAEADRASALADIQLKSTQMTRRTILYSQGAINREQLDQAERDRDAAKAAMGVADQKIQAARASLEQAQASIQQAKANASFEAQNLQDTRVTTPIAGVVGNIPLKLGDYVKVGDTITNIVQNQSLDLNLSIPSERAAQLRIGLPVQLTGPKDSDTLGTGRISFISPQVNSESQAILAKANFPNPEGALRDGQLVRARVIWKRSPGVTIPTTAVSRIGGQNFVFVAESAAQPQKQGQPQLVAKQKPVKLGDIRGNNYQVVDGLKPGEKIVVSGILNLSDGAPIIPES